MSECQHPIAKKYGRTPYGQQRWRCADCGKSWSDPRPRRFVACRCGRPAVQLFLCERHWQELPETLRLQWRGVSGNGGSLGGRLEVALAIMTWRPKR